MKKLILCLVLAGVVLAQPVALDPEPVVNVEMKKLDARTLEVKTTTTMVNTVQHDKAVLQTMLDHIPDQKAKIQYRYDTEMAAINAREAELIKMMEEFK